MRLKLNRLKKKLDNYLKKPSLKIFIAEAVILKKILSYMLPPEVGIVILGTKAAGKTTLWNFLTQGKSKLHMSSGVEKIKECLVEINGIERIIKKSRDIAGEDSIVANYDEFIKDEDFILFMCNAKEVLFGEQNDEYTKIVRARLKKIFSHIHSLENEKMKIHIIATHADQLESDFTKWPSLKSDVLERIGRPFLQNNKFDETNFILMDTSNKECCSEYVSEFLFKKQ